MPVLFIVKTRSFTIREFIKNPTLQKQPFVAVYKKNLLEIFPKFTGKHQHRSLYLIKLLASSLQLYSKSDPGTDVFSVISEILKNTFFIELIWATLYDSSSQALCLEIIMKILKWHQLRQFCWLYYKLRKVFCLLR